MSRLNNSQKILSGIRISLAGNLSASLSISLLLSVTGLFLSSYFNINIIIGEVAGRPEAVLYLNDSISQKDIDELERYLKNMPEVEDARYISKESALEEVRRELSEKKTILDGLNENPLPSSFLIFLDINNYSKTAMQRLEMELKKMPYTEEIRYDGNWLDIFSFIMVTVRSYGAIFIASLSMSTVIISIYSMQLIHVLNRSGISMLKGYHDRPALLRFFLLSEGTLLGMTGAIFASIFLYILKLLAESLFIKQMSISSGITVELLPHNVLAAIMLLGIISGAIGGLSLFSNNRKSR